MTRKITLCAMLSAVAIALAYIELLIPVSTAVPGIKLGLPNLVVLITLYLMGTRYAFAVSMVRIFIVSLLFSGVSGLLYSLAGGLLSFAVMALFCRLRPFGIIGVSVAGAACHNIGQIGVSILLMATPGLLVYLPVLLLTGVVTGIVIGASAWVLLKRLRPVFDFIQQDFPFPDQT